VAFCPKAVLEMEGGKAKVARPGDCIKCMLCELRCPDFAITVE
jgi:2-oxoglutarate ferredoxin oxidoreductase subunit delta